MAEIDGVRVGLSDGFFETLLVGVAALVAFGYFEAIGPADGEEEGAGALFGRRFVFDDLVGVAPARARRDGFELAPVHRLPVAERVEARDPPAACEYVVVAFAQVDDGGGGVLGGVASHFGDGVVSEQVYGSVACGVADVGVNEV